ncbi:MAG TPA: hypothetical protein VE710_18290 [Candidatus Bathyarchaeia archaeon]|nr:hypothetical protein [Candidatus Bathyarchaeia archaeon]
MKKRPVMWAIAFKYQEGAFYNFEKGEEDLELSFSHLVPSKDMAEDFIEDYLAITYIPVPVTIISFSKDAFVYTYEKPSEWQ